MVLLNLAPPNDENTFDSLMLDLWKKMLGSNTVKKVGRRGQSQHGVDIYGLQNGKDSIGIQCKWKSLGKELTPEEVANEVNEARGFKPPLREYYIVTTARNDEKIEEYARLLTEAHRKKDLFIITVLGWDDLNLEIQSYPDLLNKYYKNATIHSAVIENGFTRLGKEVSKVQLKQDRLQAGLDPVLKRISAASSFLVDDIIEKEYQKEIDYSKSLVKKDKPIEAFKYLKRLKKRIWHKCSDKTKFRILTNMGAAELLYNEIEGARLLIKALKYNRRNQKALANATLGYSITNQKKRCERTLKEVLKMNPDNITALSVRSRLAAKTREVSEIEKSIPRKLRNNAEIAFCIAQIAAMKKNYKQSKKWFEKVMKTKRKPIVQETFASTLIQEIIDSIHDDVNEPLDKMPTNQMERAISLLENAWRKYEKSELRKYKLHCLSNRAVAKALLGDFKAAEKDLIIANAEDPRDKTIARNLILTFLRTERYKEIIDFCRKNRTSAKVPEIQFDLAFALSELKEFSKAEVQLKYLIKYLPQKSRVRNSALLLLADIYVKQEDVQRIQNIFKEYRIPKITKYLILTKFFSAKGNKKRALVILNAVSKNQSSLSNYIKNILAERYYSMGYFDEALTLSKTVANIHVSSIPTMRLLSCYYHTGELGTCLDICIKLRRKYGPLLIVTEIEATILEEIGDIPATEIIYSMLVQKYDKHLRIHLRYAFILYKMNKMRKFNKLKTRILRLAKETELTHEDYINISTVLTLSKDTSTAINMMYEAVRTYYHIADVHLRYIGLLLLYGQNRSKERRLKKVRVNCAVCLEHKNKTKKWYVIEDRIQSDLKENEINLTHAITKKLINRTINQKILIKSSPYQKEYVKIVDIKHKHIYLLHKCTDEFEKSFPNKHSFWQIKLDEKDIKKAKLPKEFDKMFENIKTDRAKYTSIMRLYKQGVLTIGGVAQVLHSNPLELFMGLVNERKIPIRSCIGTKDEMQWALTIIAKKPKLVIDITSLVVITEMDICDLLAKNFGKLGIAQSTIDFLHMMLEEKKTFGLKDTTIVGKEGDTYFRQPVLKEDIGNAISFLQKMISNIHTHCYVIPSKAMLKMPRKLRLLREKILGKLFHDTSLVVFDKSDHILYSEDLHFRILCERLYCRVGTWTHAVLKYLRKNGAISEQQYCEHIVKLVTYNFVYTAIDKNILMIAAEKSGWQAIPPFSYTCEYLNGYHTKLDIAVEIAAEVLYQLWHNVPIMAIRRDTLLDGIFYEIFRGRRSRERIIKSFTNAIDRKFRVAQLSRDKIINALQSWLKLHITG